MEIKFDKILGRLRQGEAASGSGQGQPAQQSIVFSAEEDAGGATLTVSYDGGSTYEYLCYLSNGADGADGSDGSPGSDGTPGTDGADGAAGKSAYQYAVEAGYAASEEQFAADLAATEMTTMQADFLPADGSIRIMQLQNMSVADVVNCLLAGRNVRKSINLLTYDPDMPDLPVAINIATMSYTSFFNGNTGSMFVGVNLELQGITDFLVAKVWRKQVEFTAAELNTLINGTEQEIAALYADKQFITGFLPIT